MGQARAAAEQVMEALENHDLDSAYELLAENFTFYDPASPAGEINGDAWLGSTAKIFEAFPDFAYNFEIVEEDGNQVWVEFQMEGTHSYDLDLSAMGRGVIAATGRKVVTERGTSLGTVNSAGQLERIEVVEASDNSGMNAVLGQIGAL